MGGLQRLHLMVTTFICVPCQLAAREPDPPDDSLRRLHGKGRHGGLRVLAETWQGPQGKDVYMITALPVTCSVVVASHRRAVTVPRDLPSVHVRGRDHPGARQVTARARLALTHAPTILVTFVQ